MSGIGAKGQVDGREPVERDAYVLRWENLWAAGLSKGQAFDCSNAAPVLLDLLSSKRLDVQGKRVLVPGCGRGYDVAAFAAAGAAASVGLEISVTAVQAAGSYLAEALQGMPDAAGNAAVLMGDFFTWQDDKGGYDVGYDYTFGCAMHPSERASWAAGWARALQPGGTLVALLFPVDPTRDQNMGPPFPVTPELYDELLLPAGFERVSMETVPDELSHEARRGMERLGLWRRT